MQKEQHGIHWGRIKISERKVEKQSSVDRRVHQFLRGLKIKRQVIDAGKITWVHGVGCIRQVLSEKGMAYKAVSHFHTRFSRFGR